MPDNTGPTEQPIQIDQAKPGFWDRCAKLTAGINERFHFFVSLPVVTVLGSTLTGHFQYLSAYQEKVATEAKQQLSAAETTYTEVATMFAKAITLQQYLFFDFCDATAADNYGDDTLESKDARAIFPQYDGLRISLRENIDLLARKVELNLDWRSDPNHDAAERTTIGTDPVTRIALGYYDFECEKDGPMPSFQTGSADAELPPTEEMLKTNRNAKPLSLDWYSTKHELLTLYYCFEVAHRRILPARQWAAKSPIDPARKEVFVRTHSTIQDNINREAIRLNAFMTLAARRIEMIQVKFRPLPSYCHLPFIREIIDAYSKTCTPIRLARN